MPQSKPTCLFTGELLAAQTKVEHTIQQSVGGRIKSKTVSSNNFNRAAGEIVDQAFAQAFAPIFNRIGWATPSSHRQPNLPAKISGDDGKYEVCHDGKFVRKGFAVLERDPQSNRVTAAAGANPDAMKKQFRWPQMTIELTPPPQMSEATIGTHMFSVEIEIAALKSILLTFDHLLRDNPDRFTRDINLSGVRTFVKEYVFTGKADEQLYDEIVLGLQYDKLQELHRLRRLVPTTVTPFEHVMLVSASPATRTVDAIWWIAGIHPYGFRLCSKWTGAPFGFIVVSGVLKGTETNKADLLEDFTATKDASRRARQSSSTSREQLQARAHEMGEYLREAWQRAIDFTERNRPDYVRDSIIYFAQLDLQEKKGGTILNALRRHLEVLFQRRLIDSNKRKRFEQIMQRHMRQIPDAMKAEAVSSITHAPAKFSWDQWYKTYIAILDALLEPLGMPGEVHQREAIVKAQRPEKP